MKIYFFFSAYIIVLYLSAYDKRIIFESTNIFPNVEDSDCSFNWSEIKEAFQFFPVHLINWFFAALIARDFVFLHFWSIFDELVERSFENIIDDVRECWWDTIILDILVANNFSIWIGTNIISQHYSMFDWFGRKDRSSILQWRIFHEPNRFLIIFLTLLVIAINLISGFLLMHSLKISETHIFNFIRLLFWFILGKFCFQYNYAFIETKLQSWQQIQSNLILALALLGEILIIIKYGRDCQELGSILDLPKWIIRAWVIGIILGMCFYLRLKYHTAQKIK